jgi:hypothetical protein
LYPATPDQKDDDSHTSKRNSVKHLKSLKILTLLSMLPVMKDAKRRDIARFTEKLILPLAVLSVAVVWYCWSKEGVAWHLTSLYMMAVISKQNKGYARRSPVPASFLEGSMLPL